jgi:hypothetical protein
MCRWLLGRFLHFPGLPPATHPQVGQVHSVPSSAASHGGGECKQRRLPHPPPLPVHLHLRCVRHARWGVHSRHPLSFAKSGLLCVVLVLLTLRSPSHIRILFVDCFLLCVLSSNAPCSPCCCCAAPRPVFPGTFTRARGLTIDDMSYHFG